MKDENIYYIITLELGVVILNSDKDVIYFNKFNNAIESHTKFKDKDYEEIVQNLESDKFLEKHKNIKILTNFPELSNLLKDRDYETIEKISPPIEKYIQINKLNIYLKSNIFSNEKEIIKELRDFSLKWSSLKIQE